MNFRNIPKSSLVVASVSLLLIAVPGFADSAPREPRTLQFILTPEERTAADRIKAVLSKFVSPLERDVATFHYQRADNPKDYRPADRNELIRAASELGLSFYNPDFTDNSMLGPGHYVAIDASASRDFGGVIDPQLYVAAIRAGVNVLDGRETLEAKETAFSDVNQTLNCLKGIVANSYYSNKVPESNGVSDWFSFFRSSPNVSCRKAVIQAATELKISALMYGYSAANEFAGCRNNRTEAFLVISPDAIDPDKISYFSNEKSIDSWGVGGFVKRLFEEGDQDLSLVISRLAYQSARASEIPTDLATFNSNAADYKTWKEKYIFKCGPTLWAKEKVANGAGVNSTDFKDAQIVQVKYQLAKAYREKVDSSNQSNNGYRYLDFNLMRGFNEMEYRLAGLPPGKSSLLQWAKAKQTIQRGSGSNSFLTYTEAAKVLDLPSSLDASKYHEMVSQRMVESYVQLKTHPENFFSSLKEFGISPQVGILMINLPLIYLHGIPFVAGELPLSDGKNYSHLAEENKAKYISYLQRCTEEYANPQLSLSQIDLGPCGMIDLNNLEQQIYPTKMEPIVLDLKVSQPPRPMKFEMLPMPERLPY